MRGWTRETEILSSLFLDKRTQKTLDAIVEEIERNIDYDTKALWDLQAALIPYHPHSSMKNFMTPLQCAKDEIEICNINYSSTYVILYCTKYLQEVIRFSLSIVNPVMKLRYKVAPMDTLIKKLDQNDTIPKLIIKALEQIHSLNRKCLKDDNLPLAPKDAVTFYICSMIIGSSLLDHSDLYIKDSENKRTDSLYKLDITN